MGASRPGVRDKPRFKFGRAFRETDRSFGVKGLVCLTSLTLLLRLVDATSDWRPMLYLSRNRTDEAIRLAPRAALNIDPGCFRWSTYSSASAAHSFARSSAAPLLLRDGRARCHPRRVPGRAQGAEARDARRRAANSKGAGEIAGENGARGRPGSARRAPGRRRSAAFAGRCPDSGRRARGETAARHPCKNASGESPRGAVVTERPPRRRARRRGPAAAATTTSTTRTNDSEISSRRARPPRWPPRLPYVCVYIR